MKPIFYSPRCLVLLLGGVSAANAAVMTFTDNAAMDIPDGSSLGLARVIATTSTVETITSIDLQLNISVTPGQDAFVGDLYAYLSNGAEIVILLNRAGRTVTAPAGYDDNQPMNVIFSDSGVANIHSYRIALSGSPTIELGGPLLGVWQPDGRTTDPGVVLDTDPPTTNMDVFTGAAVTDDWILFVADLSTGGEHRLDSWTMTMQTVPEPSVLLLGGLALPLVFRRRRVPC